MNNFEQPMGKDSPDNIEMTIPEADIFRDYEMRVLQLGIQMATLRHYIKAKADFDRLQSEINSLMMNYSPSEKEMVANRAHIEEKFTLLQRYQQMIDIAEKDGAPEEVLAETKEKLQELQEKQQQLKDIILVGKENPGLN